MRLCVSPLHAYNYRAFIHSLTPSKRSQKYLSVNLLADGDRTVLIYLKKAIAAVGFIVIAACVVLLWVFMGAEFGIPGLIIALAILIVITGAWRKIWIIIVTTPRDVK